MKKVLSLIPSAVLALALVVSCASSADSETIVLPAAPSYADSTMWYEATVTPATPVADVFYVTPTCIWDWTDEAGQTVHYMNVTDSAQRAAVDASNLLACNLFGKHCRFFSPYYRQITMQSWFLGDDEIERRFKYAMQDVVTAFRYFIDNLNEGRPFYLAGHSQGAKAVIELLKSTLTPAEASRLIATYAFGYSVSEDELARYDLLKPATGELDSGVLIGYNSVSRTDAVAWDDNVVCINPVSWTTDTTYVAAADNPGSVFFDRTGASDTLFNQVGVRLDAERHVLVIDGLNDEDYFIPSISQIFPLGNYHVQELNLYFLSVQRNILRRAQAFSGTLDGDGEAEAE